MRPESDGSCSYSAQSRSETGAPEKKSAQGKRFSTRPSTPPYNPGLQKLVEGKQAWGRQLDAQSRARGFIGWHQRGYLPHYDAPNCTQLVTLRLVDSLPASRRGEWEHLLGIENDRERRRQLEEYLDRGLGACWLRQPAIARLTEETLRFFDRQRYALLAWVVMPNHVHLLVEVWDTPLWQLVKSWKTFCAREANKLLGRNGPFWQREYMDTLIRNQAHLRTAIRYIETNPVRAKLVRVAAEWPWSSARFRDEYGVLKYAH